MADVHHLLQRRTLIEGVIGIVLLTLAFFAIAASDASAVKMRTYWTVIVVVYALAALAVDRLYPGHKPGAETPGALYVVAHWIGVFCAIQLVYFFVLSGRMANTDMGLTNGLILALGTLLGGIHGNWRLIVAGLALALAVAGVAFVEQYLWFLGGVALLAVLAFVFGSRMIRGAGHQR